MEYKLDKGCHSVYSLQFHLVLVTKYRKEVLVGKLAQRLKEIVEEVAKHFKVRIIEQEADKDHIHILFSGKPTLTLSKFVNSLKSVTSRKLRKEFPDVMRKELWGGRFWSQSYFIASVGQVKLEDVKRYVQSQGRD
ncbi:IS200/IS605 family transposase [Hydrogenivirga sp. 128-5-R1-1]|uniref:IS200/IS605 family transposase n=1 Tax=Hydrogenivirga sp. 128-5-R1-1 TaxID=392423 RepID=UPI00015F193C|nr:IS200/IS605 family transposase [Hydrogenivirga sp. 128-5-R1-1]EDP75378.1 IS200-like transposase [Hydrogenivirga sp. 128-5-R1-1]